MTKNKISPLKKLWPVSVAVFFALLIVVGPWGNSLDLFSYDMLFLLRGSESQPENVIVVEIDEASFRQLGEKWTLGNGWPRGIHAQLIRSLKYAGASVIAFDLLFSEPSSTEQDDELAAAIDEAGNVVLASQVNVEPDRSSGAARCIVIGPTPIQDLARSNLRVGFSNVVPDSDRFIRGFYLDTAKLPNIECTDRQPEKAFSIVATEEYLKRMVGRKQGIPNYHKLATDGFARINYIGGANSIKTVPYYKALEPEINLPEGYFRDALVFIGATRNSASSVREENGDRFLIPFSRLYPSNTMTGVEIHAQAAYSLLQQNTIKRMSLPLLILIGVLGSLLFGVGFLTWRLLYGGILLGVLTLATLLASYFSFSRNGIYFAPLPILIPMSFAFLSSPIVRYWAIYKQKSFIRLAFATYISPKLVDRLIENPGTLKLVGEEVYGTVVFINIVGLTTTSDKLSPSQLVSFINETMGEFSDVIIRHDGMLDKYIGERVMALWGCPLSDNLHAIQACRAVMKIRDSVGRIKEKALGAYGIDITVRAGLSSGKMITGNMGGGFRFSYTAIGNEVNLASYLELLNKTYGTYSLLSEGAAVLVREQFVLREVDIVCVNEQESHIKIYTILGDSAGVAPIDYRMNELYQHGRGLYRAREWSAARDVFIAALELKVDDGPSKEFLRRIDKFSKNPPPVGWDGVHRESAQKE